MIPVYAHLVLARHRVATILGGNPEDCMRVALELVERVAQSVAGEVLMGGCTAASS